MIGKYNQKGPKYVLYKIIIFYYFLIFTEDMFRETGGKKEERYTPPPHTPLDVRNIDQLPLYAPRQGIKYEIQAGALICNGTSNL